MCSTARMASVEPTVFRSSRKPLSSFQSVLSQTYMRPCRFGTYALALIAISSSSSSVSFSESSSPPTLLSSSITSSSASSSSPLQTPIKLWKSLITSTMPIAMSTRDFGFFCTSAHSLWFSVSSSPFCQPPVWSLSFLHILIDMLTACSPTIYSSLFLQFSSTFLAIASPSSTFSPPKTPLSRSSGTSKARRQHLLNISHLRFSRTSSPLQL
mmetsp:Transcript_2312/g.4767  ORF Transcript_2312/g.4767 Transcript_2312/m.4767 type:complete len:212 (-) Transcript_2312:576-1211(-)